MNIQYKGFYMYLLSGTLVSYREDLRKDLKNTNKRDLLKYQLIDSVTLDTLAIRSIIKH